MAMSLEEVYRRALYRVEAREPFVLRVGCESAALRALYADFGCSSAAFLTAANPGGVKVSDTINFHAERQLSEKLDAMAWPTIPGIGLDADETSDWPGERSVLVLGLPRETAIRLGLEHGQLAILWCPASAIPELLMLDPISPANGFTTKL